MKLVYDIETDGLLDELTTIHCLVAHNLDTGNTYCYSDADNSLPSIEDGVSLLKNADVLIGHNIIGFDHMAIRKLYGVDLSNVKSIDTWIMSQVLNYRRPHKHGLKGWGEYINNSKIDYDDWTAYSKEMLRYCKQDVMLNVDIYHILMAEFNKIREKNPLISEGLRIEMETAKFEAATRNHGWLFDTTTANLTLRRIINRMEEIESVIEPRLPEITRFIDKEPKFPKFTKSGAFAATTKRMLEEYTGTSVKEEDWPATRSFQRKKVIAATLGNMEQVKEYLYSIGWEPDDWKMKKIGRDWIKEGPKLTTTSLEKLGEPGLMIDEWTTLRSRKGVLEGWLQNVKDGRLRGRMWVEGTPTFRCRHEVIANLPAVTAPWGKELRELLVAEEGYRVVGADSAGNQFRSLAHYVNDPQLTEQILSGDIHQYNADILGCSRRVAKTWIYAFLFGAGSTKLGQVLTGKRSPTAGIESMNAYGNAIPTLAKLKNKLEDMWKQTSYNGEGYIPGLDGRKLYAPQPYQTLNYLLQGCEAITCKSAIAYQMEKIKAEGLDAYPALFYHDESAWVASEKDAPRVLEILIESFREGPKAFGVTIMDGDGVIGDSYADVH